MCHTAETSLDVLLTVFEYRINNRRGLVGTMLAYYTKS